MSGSLISVHGSMLQEAIQQRWVLLEGGGFKRTLGLGFLSFLESFIATLEDFFGSMSLCPDQASLEASLELP